MRVLLDMGIGRRAAELLRDGGIDAVHLGERGLVRLSDEGILALGTEEARTVVTLDADFSALLALSGADRPSVIHLRIEGLDYRAAAQMIAGVIARAAEDLDHGCIASVTPAGIRVRRLPILPPR